MRWRHVIMTACLIAALWRCGVVAFAQTPSLDPATLLTDLNSSDFAVREAATEALMTASEVADATWVRLFAEARSPEQRHRLLMVARHHVLQSLRRRDFPERGAGSLGMTQGVISPAERQHYGRAGVLVRSTLPGFPAYAYLRAGDLIVAINGMPIGTDLTNDQFQQKVQENPAGQPVTLTVIRDGQELTKRFTLASFEALQRMYEQSDAGVIGRYEMQWRQTRGRLMGQSAEQAPVKLDLQS